MAHVIVNGTPIADPGTQLQIEIIGSPGGERFPPIFITGSGGQIHLYRSDFHTIGTIQFHMFGEKDTPSVKGTPNDKGTPNVKGITLSKLREEIDALVSKDASVLDLRVFLEHENNFSLCVGAHIGYSGFFLAGAAISPPDTSEKKE